MFRLPVLLRPSAINNSLTIQKVLSTISTAMLLTTCLPSFSLGEAFFMSGNIVSVQSNINGSGVDLAGLVQVGD